jgi:nucleotide-binding universal stress UspA family protein
MPSSAIPALERECRQQEAKMGLKIILAAVTGREADTATLDVAAAIARKFSAHIDVMHVRSDPRDAIPFLGEGASGVLIEQIMTAAERDAGSRSSKAHTAFEAWRAKSGLPIAMRPGEQGGASVAWHEETGTEDECMVRRGRVADIIVVGRPPADDSGMSTVLFETALFDTGRPVLLAPPGLPANREMVGAPAAILWTGGAEASRAVAAAVPFLATSGQVSVIPANPGGNLADATPIVDYLAWHGIKASTVEPLIVSPSAGSDLLGRARTMGAGLLVMGAYTQSRLRQLVYGSVTKHVLMQGDLPVIMAH